MHGSRREDRPRGRGDRGATEPQLPRPTRQRPRGARAPGRQDAPIPHPRAPRRPRPRGALAVRPDPRADRLPPQVGDNVPASPAATPGMPDRCSRRSASTPEGRCRAGHTASVDQLFDTGGRRAEPGHTPGGRTPVPVEEGPLAVRMRPRTLDEVVGQDHLLAEGTALRAAIERGQPHSMVLYGPPGSGKTTLARIVAAASSAAFEELSAVEAGRAEVRKVLERAAHRRTSPGEQTIRFLAEIHRFNKAQQDTLLPAVEEGLVTLIGATTENPYFEVNAALLSRTRIYELHLLSDADLTALLRRALGHERGIPDPPAVDDEALEMLAARAAGGARSALVGLELAVETADGGAVRLPIAEQAMQRKAVLYDKGGDRHYDLISA